MSEIMALRCCDGALCHTRQYALAEIRSITWRRYYAAAYAMLCCYNDIIIMLDKGGRRRKEV